MILPALAVNHTPFVTVTVARTPLRICTVFLHFYYTNIVLYRQEICNVAAKQFLRIFSVFIIIGIKNGIIHIVFVIFVI